MQHSSFSSLQKQSVRCCVEALESRALFSAAGTLDPTFGSGGKLMTSSPNGDGASAVQSDGKIVVAGLNNTNSQLEVARFNSDGSYDTSFGSAGTGIMDITATARTPSAMAIEPDGKIVIGLRGIIGAIRLNSDGSVDTAFGTNGIAQTRLGSISHNNDTSSLAIQSDGKIIVGGADVTDGPINWAIVRFNSDGSLDNSFHIQDITTGRDSNVHDLALVSGGKFLAAGDGKLNGTAGPMVMRFNSDGTVDSTFGTNGQAVAFVGNSYQDTAQMALQSNGDIILSGEAVNSRVETGVARLTPDGTLDTKFGHKGLTTIIASTRAITLMQDMTVEPNDKIVLAGATTPSSTSTADELTVIRLNSNGKIDNSFGSHGKASTRFSSKPLFFETADDVFIQDNKILAIGTSFSDTDPINTHQLIMARFLDTPSGKHKAR